MSNNIHKSAYQKNRVAITGIGAICGLGHQVEEIWNTLLEGISGVSLIENHDTKDLPVKIAGEVKNFKIDEDLLSVKEARRYDKFIHYALQSAKEALTDANLNKKTSPYSKERCGCILGVGMGGFPMMEETHKEYLNKGHRRVSPFFIPGIIPNLSAGLISIKFGLKGINYSLSSACASSAHAISNAFFEIESGRHDMMLTGGAESVICNLPLCGFSSMKAISKSSEDPKKVSRPFDKKRSGFVIGEGSGILILENLKKASDRGAKIYAEVVGHGATSDAFHITAPHETGDGAIKCMRQALEHANLNPNNIDYINTHGTSTPLGDILETKAIKETFKAHAYNLNISATKSMTGHLLGAAGGIESIFCAKSLFHGIIPPTINLTDPDPECDLNYTPNIAKKKKIEYALNNSFGFGGTNSSIIFKRHLS